METPHTHRSDRKKKSHIVGHVPEGIKRCDFLDFGVSGRRGYYIPSLKNLGWGYVDSVAGHFPSRVVPCGKRVLSPYLALLDLYTTRHDITMMNQPNEKTPNGTAQPAKRHEEYQYLDLIREILDEGEIRPDRYVRKGKLLTQTWVSSILSFSSPL